MFINRVKIWYIHTTEYSAATNKDAKRSKNRCPTHIKWKKKQVLEQYNMNKTFHFKTLGMYAL